MSLEAADLTNPEKVLGQFGTMETRLAALEGKLAEMAQPPSLDKHPAGFCETPETCSQCQAYAAQAKQYYAEAHNKGVKAGRNNTLDKLDQASKDLDMVPQAQILAARLAQIEASEGDTHAQVLLIRSSQGELVGVKV